MRRALIFAGALVSFAIASRAASSGGGVLIPDLPLGDPQPKLGPKSVPFQASRALWCSPGHYITSWNLQELQTDLDLPGPANNFVGGIFAVCDDGFSLGYVSYSYKSDSDCKNVRKVDATLLQSPQASYLENADGFTSITYRHGTWLDSLLNVGGYGGDGGSASCPDDMLIIGYTAAASCYGVTHFQAICGTV